MLLILLTSRRFFPLFLRQFFSVFADNFVKNFLVLLLLKTAPTTSAALISLAGAAFIAPSFLTSALGGECADKYDKARLIYFLSLIDVAIALLAAIGIVLSNIFCLFIALIFFGLTSALFGPAKYGVLPDHLTYEELPTANALVESATFLAILGGAIIGGFASQAHNKEIFAFGLVIITILGLLSARFIPKTTRAEPKLAIDLNIVRSTLRLLQLLSSQKKLQRLTRVTSLFWFFGSIAMALMPPIITQCLKGDETIVTLHLLIIAFSIALGSGVAAYVSKTQLSLMPASIGGLLIALSACDLAFALLHPSCEQITQDSSLIVVYFSQSSAIHAAIDFALLAFSGGLMIVPAFAAIQMQSPSFERARIIAAVNVHNSAFMVLAGGGVAVLQRAGMTFSAQLFFTSVIAAISTFWIWRTFVKDNTSEPYL